MSQIIDSYRYSQSYDRDKMNFYEKYTFTTDEKDKTSSIKESIINFEKALNKDDQYIGINYYPQERIKYYSDIGYISFVNEDRDIIDIHFYGREENEAIINAMIDYEFEIISGFESKNRKKLNKEYSERFLDGTVSEDDYHGPFFCAELGLKDFRKYYGESIPKKIVKYYEDYLNSYEGNNYIYDYETDELVLNKN